MIENWLPITGYENYYEISSFGRIRSLDRFVKSRNGSTRMSKGKILKQNLDSCGYVLTNLSKHGKLKPFYVHRLVAEHFLYGVNDQVNHKDFCTWNNHVDNLEWCTHSENIQHSINAGRRNAYSNEKCAKKLTKEKVREIRQLSLSSITQKEIADKFGINQTTAGKIIRNESWRILDDED